MKNIFCTICAQVTPHQGLVDGNGEFVFGCTAVMVEDKDGNSVPHHFVKFPPVGSAQELEEMITEHQAINQPVAEAAASANEQRAILNEVLQDGTQVTVTG